MGHPEDVVRRNDLAVALLKLGQYEESKTEFERIESQEPGRYETLSNLGVLHKKMGEYDEAARVLQQALEIKPEGHLGVGDYYVKAMAYLDGVKQGGGAAPAKTFLGYSYDSFRVPYGVPLGEDIHANWFEVMERVQKLIHADRTFADGYLVLGDLLSTQRDLNLALWAYIRADMLGHPNPVAIQERISAIFEHWRGASPSRVENMDIAVASIKADLEKAAEWISHFEAAEAALVAAQGEVDFNSVKAEMTRRGIEKLEPADHGMRALVRVDWRPSVSQAVSAAALVLLVILFAWIRRRRLAEARR